MKNFVSLNFLFFLFMTFSAQAESLTAQKVLEMTFTKSLPGKSYELDKKIGKETVRSAKSQYDLIFDSSVSYTNDQSERSNTILGTKSTTAEFNFGLSQLTPLGSEVEIAFLNTKNTTNSPFSTLPSYYDSRGYFSVSQPLLNNFFGYATRKNLELAKELQKQTQTTVDFKLMELAYNNLKYYWDWYLYTKMVDVDEEALSSSINLYQSNRSKLNVGLIESHDIHAFEANVELMKNALLTSQAEQISARGKLSVALDFLEEQIVFGAETQKQKNYPPWEEMADRALKHHPKYLALQHELQVQNISVAMAKNAKLPQLDLAGSLILNGLDANYSTAAGDLNDGHTVVQGGVSLSFPIQNRSARASYKKNQYQQMQLLYSVKNLENKIVSEVKNSHLEYQKTHERLGVMAQAVKFQKSKWEGEIKKYDQGRSDPDNIIRYQNDYLAARRLYIQTQVAYHLAALELDYIRGELHP